MRSNEELDRYRSAQDAREERQKSKGIRAYWHNPSDKIALLVLVANIVLAIATAGLWLATRNLVQDAELAGRAWVGPLDAKIVTFAKGKPLRAVITYKNTGKQPAETTDLVVVHTFSEKRWRDGAAVRFINAAKTSCMKIGALGAQVHVAYPTTAFNSFQLIYDASRKDLPDAQKVIVDDDILRGETKIVFIGCFIYRTVGTIHHSAFCYYNDAGIDRQHLPYCNVGQDAD